LHCDCDVDVVSVLCNSQVFAVSLWCYKAFTPIRFMPGSYWRCIVCRVEGLK
jgi:hypothetical protein